MPVPQPGMFALGTRSHLHLELDVAADAAVPDVVAALGRLREPSVTAGGANLVVGIGATLWRRLAGERAPEVLAPFPGVDGIDDHRAPATQHDLWVWVHGTGEDVILDTGRTVAAALDGVATLVDEQAAFVYHDSRDLTGFIDGTANPAVDDAVAVACLPDGAPGAGGSFALVQRWVHDLDAFDALEVADQERVVGRTKSDSIELAGDEMPVDAHVARVEIDDEVTGEELALWRRSTPFGGVGRHGLVFVAFSADPARFLRMLRRMFGVEDGVRDRLTDFSTPETGAVYFVPSVDDLAALGAVPDGEG